MIKYTGLNKFRNSGFFFFKGRFIFENTTMALEILTLKFRGLSDEEDEDAELVDDAPDVDDEELGEEDEEGHEGKNADSDDVDVKEDEE